MLSRKLISSACFYAPICVGSLLASPVFIFLSVGFGIPFVPLIIFAILVSIGTFLLPVAFTVALWLILAAVTLRPQRSYTESFVRGCIAALACYVSLIASAELSWTIQIQQQERSGAIDCVISRELLIKRAYEMRAVLRSDDTFFATPHAVARRGDKTLIWSFSEGKFVYTLHRGVPCQDIQ